MGTASNKALAAGLFLVGLVAGACGAGGNSGMSAHGAGSSAAATGSSPARAPFAWLERVTPPLGWPVARIPSGAAIPYPPGWRRIEADPGTASAATFDGESRFTGYLNITQRQGGETLRNWSHFRVDHNADEHQRNITTLAAATSLRFRTGEGSCVRDAYTTKTGSRYIEIACLVSGRRSSVVVVGASPPQAWPRISPLLERAISGVVA